MKDVSPKKGEGKETWQNLDNCSICVVSGNQLRYFLFFWVFWIIFITKCFSKLNLFSVPMVLLNSQQSTFLVRDEPTIRVNGGVIHTGPPSGPVAGVMRVSWGRREGCLHPPNPLKAWCPFLPRVGDFFEDISPGFIRELSVDITRERWLSPASLYGLGEAPWEIM